MLLNGTLTYYNKESKQFKTIFIQDIDDNLNPELDSFALLNKYYSNNEESVKLFSNNSLSNFKKDNIPYQDFDIQTVFSNSIEELLNNIRQLDFCVNYIYYDGIWYHHIFHLFESIVSELPTPNQRFGMGFFPNVSNLSLDLFRFLLFLLFSDNFETFLSKTLV